MDEIRLEDIIPQAASFTLRRTGKTYHLRPVSLDDELWMSQTFGEQITDIFKHVKMKDICRIVFRLMEEEDKEEFAAKEVKFMNEIGESETKRMGGAELLFIMISGYPEKIEIFQALLTTIGVSRPMEQKLTDAEKKRVQESKTGQKSSTSSRVNTAGRRKKSLPGRQKKYRSGSLRSGSVRI